MHGGNHPGRPTQLPYKAMPFATMTWVSIPHVVIWQRPYLTYITRTYAYISGHGTTKPRHCYIVTRTSFTPCSRLDCVMVCNGIQPLALSWPHRSAAIMRTIDATATATRRPQPAWARRSGQGSRAGQGGGVPALDPGGGGVSMYIGPPPYLGHPKRIVPKT